MCQHMSPVAGDISPVETGDVSPGETHLRRIKMKSKLFKKNSQILLNNLKLLRKVKGFPPLLTLFDENLIEREDQYRIIFHGAVRPERPYEVDFFEKSSEFGDSDWSEKYTNLSEIDAILEFSVTL